MPTNHNKTPDHLFTSVILKLHHVHGIGNLGCGLNGIDTIP